MTPFQTGWRRFFDTFSLSWGVILGFTAANFVVQVVAKMLADLTVWALGL